MSDESLTLSVLDYLNDDSGYWLSMAAGWNQTREDWRNVILLARDSCFAGWIRNHIVATGALVPYRNCGWIGMLLVDAPCRRRGFGGKMIDLLLYAADQKGVRWVGLDATDMGKPLYLKKGFVEVGTIQRWQLARSHAPLRIFNVRPFKLESQADSDSARALDREATGMDRYCLPLFLTGAADSQYMVCERDGQIAGFGLARAGRLGPYIGPVVARSSEVAIAIISRLLEKYSPAADAPVFIDVPGGSSIEPWLSVEGFEVVRSWTRMIRGQAELGNPEIYFAIAGPEYG